MVDLSASPAMKTVEFGRAITGQDLIDAVEKACQESGGGAYKEKFLNEDIRYLVGRRNSNDADLLVTPDKTAAHIEPGKTYESALVVYDNRPASAYDPRLTYKREDQIQSVLDFSEKLAQAVRQQQEPGLEKGLNPNALTGVSRSEQPAATDRRRWDGGTARGRADGPRAR